MKLMRKRMQLFDNTKSPEETRRDVFRYLKEMETHPTLSALAHRTTEHIRNLETSSYREYAETGDEKVMRDAIKEIQECVEKLVTRELEYNAALAWEDFKDYWWPTRATVVLVVVLVAVLLANAAHSQETWKLGRSSEADRLTYERVDDYSARLTYENSKYGTSIDTVEVLPDEDVECTAEVVIGPGAKPETFDLDCTYPWYTTAEPTQTVPDGETYTYYIYYHAGA